MAVRSARAALALRGRRKRARGAHASSTAQSESARSAQVDRETAEVSVMVTLALDGSGNANNITGLPFLDHMLDQLASHSLIDLTVHADGDSEIDSHHTTEDVALALGQAISQALGSRKGIYRFGDFSAPLDEALVRSVLDLSGRPHLTFDCDIPNERIGSFETEMIEHFFQSVCNTAGITLHVHKLAGRNSHHIVEATFKAFSRALRQAIEFDSRRLEQVPSSKGSLSQK